MAVGLEPSPRRPPTATDRKPSTSNPRRRSQPEAKERRRGPTRKSIPMSIEVEMELARLRNERQQLAQANEHLQRGCRPHGWLKVQGGEWHALYMSPDPVRGPRLIDRPVATWSEGMAWFESMRRVMT